MPYKTDGIEIEIHPGHKKGEDVAIYTSQRKITQRVKKWSRPPARIYAGNCPNLATLRLAPCYIPTKTLSPRHSPPASPYV